MVVWCMYVVLLIIVYRIMESLSSVFSKKVFWGTKKFSTRNRYVYHVPDPVFHAISPKLVRNLRVVQPP